MNCPKCNEEIPQEMLARTLWLESVAREVGNMTKNGNVVMYLGEPLDESDPGQAMLVGFFRGQDSLQRSGHVNHRLGIQGPE